MLEENFHLLSADQANFFSRTAILEQGAPFFVAVLAYAIGNQTIAQRLFAVREDLIKSTFLTATVGYGAVVIGLGMLGLIALFAGITPVDGDSNNLIPQMASAYLPPAGIALFFILVIGSLSSTADADLCALSAIVMTDVYGKNVAKGRPDPKKMLWWGRITMIVATMIGVIMATMKMDILTMLIFVGALWGSIVFPVITSFFWDRVSNAAFMSSVVIAVTAFMLVRLGVIPLVGFAADFFEVVAGVGGGVVAGLMMFAFFGRRVGVVAGVIMSVVLAVYFQGFLRDYLELLASLTAYGVSAIVCVIVTLFNKERFDFSMLSKRVTAFHDEQEQMMNTAER